MKLIPYFFTLLLLISLASVHAQENINELVEKATELAAKANKELAAGDYEAAAENFEKAANKFEAAGRPAQANAERINAGAAYDNAADKARDNKKYGKAARLYGKAAQAYTKAKAAGAAATSKRNQADAQSKIITLSTFGTGNTTGHIATINVQNNGNLPLTITPQTFFIPSDGKYQSYVGRTPAGTTVAPGQSTQIPVHGYCVDIHTPPVANGSSMPSLDDWVPVVSESDLLHSANTSSSTELVVTFGANPMPEFNLSQTSNLIQSSGFTKTTDNQTTAFTATWPGTETAIDGTIDINKDPAVFAPLIVDIVTKIETATIKLQEEGALQTPFSTDKLREKESVTQQTIWISMSILTGQEYTKNDFADNIYERFEGRTNTPVSTLNDENEEKVNDGINDFWDSFSLTGLEAKVIKEDENNIEPDLIGVDLEDVEEKEDLPKLRRPQYDRYSIARALGKTHRQACKEASLKGVDPDSELGKAFARIYKNETN